MVDDDESPTLPPYRLYVSLAVNARQDGKVRQEHVALLGSIDGHLLPGFFASVDPDISDKMKLPEWRLASLRARAEFWRQCLEVMERLANRLSSDEAKQLRQVIHSRIPYVVKSERAELELLEAKQELQKAENAFKSSQSMFALNDRIIKQANEQKADLGRASVYEARQVLKARERVDKLSKE